MYVLAIILIRRKKQPSLIITIAVQITSYFDDVTNFYPARCSHPCKNALSRHNTVTYLMKDFAMTITFFPKLKH